MARRDIIKRKKDREFIRNNRLKSQKLALKKQLKVHRREVTDTTFAFVGILLGIIITFVLVRTMVNSEFQFTIMGFLNSLKSMPYISVQSILSWELGFPDWLQWAESLITVVSFLGACLYNMIATIVWFLRFLFIG